MSKAEYNKGDRVYIECIYEFGIVEYQIIHYDGDDEFYGNVFVILDDGSKVLCNSWQCKKA